MNACLNVYKEFLETKLEEEKREAGFSALPYHYTEHAQILLKAFVF